MSDNPIDRAEPYLQMDTADESQIIEEMQGQTALIPEYVYSFKQGNRQVTSLSYSGIKEMVRRRGNFEIISTEKEETDSTIRIIVKIRDLLHRVDFLGASETEKDKPFAYVLAVNKAERNAYRKAMPAELIAKMVEAFLRAPTDSPKPQVNGKPARNVTPTIEEDKVDPLTWIAAQFPDDLACMLEFKVSGDIIMVKPKQFLGTEMFADISAVVRGLGGEYISAGKDSHFEVPCRTVTGDETQK